MGLLVRIDEASLSRLIPSSALFLLTAFLCSDFFILNSARVFSTISLEKRLSLSCQRSLLADLAKLAFDLLIEAGIVRDRGDNLEESLTVLFTVEAAWIRTMIVAWSKTEIDALEDVFNHESRILERCEETKDLYS